MGKRRRVLCVDDNDMILHLLSIILQGRGYEVLTSSDPLTAIKIMKRRRVDLALLDYEMPQMNGGELAALVKHKAFATKVVLFSGSITIPPHDLAFVDRFVRKADGVAALIEAIESLRSSRIGQ